MSIKYEKIALRIQWWYSIFTKFIFHKCCFISRV